MTAMDVAAIAEPPYTVLAPLAQTAPVVLASAHSGRNYPESFIAASRLDRVALRRSEDGFVDALFASGPDHGAPLIAATFPRAYCDANREAWELDPAMFADELPPWVNTTSPRLGAGLGTIARVVATGEAIYREKLDFAEAERRIRCCWEPYHTALRELIDDTRMRFGACLLVDCHSMPGSPSSGRPAADFVIGDAHGTTCSPRIARLVEQVLDGFGYAVRRNDPYAGGYVTRHYGRPREGVHAIQLEIARRLYMDEARIEPSARFTRLRREMETLVSRLTSDAPALLT